MTKQLIVACICSWTRASMDPYPFWEGCPSLWITNWTRQHWTRQLSRSISILSLAELHTPWENTQVIFCGQSNRAWWILTVTQFYLVRSMANCHGSANTCSEYRLLRLNERTQQPGNLYSLDGVGLYEIPVSPNIIFNSSDILGVHYPRPTSNNSMLTILYQSGGGYYDTLDCRNTNINECTYAQESILPYIAIETQSQSAAGQFTCIIV